MAAARERDFEIRDAAAEAVMFEGYAARPKVDAMLARAAALMPDVWR